MGWPGAVCLQCLNVAVAPLCCKHEFWVRIRVKVRAMAGGMAMMRSWLGLRLGLAHLHQLNNPLTLLLVPPPPCASPTAASSRQQIIVLCMRADVLRCACMEVRQVVAWHGMAWQGQGQGQGQDGCNFPRMGHYILMTMRHDLGCGVLIGRIGVGDQHRCVCAVTPGPVNATELVHTNLDPCSSGTRTAALVEIEA